jgi:hypothetical protein
MWEQRWDEPADDEAQYLPIIPEDTPEIEDSLRARYDRMQVDKEETTIFNVSDTSLSVDRHETEICRVLE